MSDPYYLDGYMHDQDQKLSTFPVCEECEEPITSGELLPLDGYVLCPDCVQKLMISVDEYMRKEVI